MPDTDLTGLPAGVWLVIALATLCSAIGAALGRGRAGPTLALGAAWLGVVVLEGLGGERFFALAQLGVLVVGIGAIRAGKTPTAVLGFVGALVAGCFAWKGWLGCPDRIDGPQLDAGRTAFVDELIPFGVSIVAGSLALVGWKVLASTRQAQSEKKREP